MGVICGLDLGNVGGWYNGFSVIDTGGFVFSYVSVCLSVAAGRSLLCRPMSGTLGSQYSPWFALRACLVEVSHVFAAVTRLGLPFIRDQNTVPRNCQVGRYMLIKSDVYETYAICYCVTVNI